MKIELGQFEGKFKNIYLIGSKPIQDWQRMIIVSFAVVLGIFIWSYFFYFSVQSEFKADFGDTYKAPPAKDKEAEIKDVVDKYKAKESVWYGGVSESELGSETGSSAGSGKI